LPSQLEKEEAQKIQKFIIIENELRQQQRDEMLRMEAEARLKGLK